MAPVSEALVQRLEAAGCIIYGKTNLPINANDIQTYNKVYGSSSNPWNLSRTPGGSSGGGAAAVAVGFTPIELGGDVGGSIRTPAAFCGIYGHKPTYGIMEKRGPFLERRPREISVRGTMARCVEDLELLAELLAGVGGIDARGLRLDLPRPTKRRLAEYKVAVWATDENAPVHYELVDAAGRVARVLEERGAVVSRTARPALDTKVNLDTYLGLVAFNDALARAPGERADVTLPGYRHATEERELVREAWEAFFGEWDVLIVPSHPTPAFPKDETMPIDARKIEVETAPGQFVRYGYWRALFWAMLTNVGLLPSITFPAGTGPATGLPLGLNVVGREYSDLDCLNVARLLRAECGFAFQPPPHPYGPRTASRL